MCNKTNIRKSKYELIAVSSAQVNHLLDKIKMKLIY